MHVIVFVTHMQSSVNILHRIGPLLKPRGLNTWPEIISRDVRVKKEKEFDSEKHYLVILDLWSQ